MKKSIMSMLRNTALALGLMLSVNAEAGFRVSQPPSNVRLQALMSLQDADPVTEEEIQSTTGGEPFTVDFAALGIANSLEAYVLLINEETGNAVELSTDNAADTKLSIPPLAMAELEMQYLGASPFYRCMIVACAETDVDDDEIVDLTAVETSIWAADFPNFKYSGENGDVQTTTISERRLVGYWLARPNFTLENPDDEAIQARTDALAEEKSFFMYEYELPNGSFMTYDEETILDATDTVAYQSANLTFNVTYSSSTPTAARTAIEYALRIWCNTLSGTVPVTLSVSFTKLGDGVLACSYSPSAGVIDGVYYPESIFSQKIGADCSSNYDIRLEFNTNYSWYFGTDKNCGNAVDFVTIMLHEVCHGLGFYDSIIPSTGGYGYGNGYYPITFDTFLYYNGSRIVNLTGSSRKTAIVSDALYFDGPNAKAANGGSRIKLYAPTTYKAGSSVSHWDTNVSFKNNTFMRFAYGGYPFHTISAIKKEAIKDLSWTLVNDTPSPPTGLIASKGTYENKIHLGWSASTGASTYTVYMATSASGAYSAVKTGLTSCSYDYPVSDSATRYFKVAGISSKGQSSDLSAYDYGYGKIGTKTLSYIEVSGPATLTSGAYADYTCTAYYSDGSHANVSTDTGCSWSISYGSTYVDLSGRRVTAHALSSEASFTIRAQYGGKTDQKTVKITTQSNITVYFYTDGNCSVFPSSREYVVGEYYWPLPAVQPYSGWTFVGFYTASSGGTLITELSKVSSTTTKLYARCNPTNNDNLANAAVISRSKGTVSGSTVGATRENNEKAPRARSYVSGSIWYTWTAPSTGKVKFSTEGSSFDTVLAVYTGGSTHDSLTEVDSNDDGGANYTSIVEFNATAGTTYKISVAGYGKNTGAVKLTWLQKDKVYLFVERLYKLCLNREPDATGIENWTTRLKNGSRDGISAVYGFCFSAEMKRRNLSNAQFVEILYKAMMDRTPDSKGKANWVERLNNGVSRAGVFKGFAESAEFTRVCESYGIAHGNVNQQWLEERDKNFGVTMFVARCYTKALNRNYDVSGLNSWCAKINSSSSKKATAIQVAKSFLKSTEFKRRNLSNSAYVDVLYQTFLGRAADSKGKASWLSKLNSGVSRDTVMAGFYNSREFTEIMAGYGIR
jgi:hypothetical protein